MNETTAAESAVLDLAPIERQARLPAEQQTGTIAAQSPMGMMLAAMNHGVKGTHLDQLVSRVEKSFYLSEWFSYAPETGAVLWRKSPSRKIRAGTPAGTPCGKRGKKYLNIKINGGYILAHQVAFFLSFGRLPITEIDHEDGDGLNNRINNLREVTHAANMKNVRMGSRNSSGVVGVTFSKRDSTWESSICADGRRIHLGSFKDKESAAKARKRAESDFGFHANHGKKS